MVANDLRLFIPFTGRMAMDELAERIKTSLESPDGELWFPELTDALVARAWESLQHDIGLTPDSYSTERVLSRSISVPREIIASLKTCRSTCATPSAIAIETLSPKSAANYQKQSVSFYLADEILNTMILSCLEDALTVINQVPSLMRSVTTLVRSLHVIKPEDDDYDVSFSEPHVPFSIFVSVPERRISNDALRVAEAIVHEAMHLQLTLIEQTLPLILKSSRKYYSPWKGTYRSGEGVLHAIYVFKAIVQFLNQPPFNGESATALGQYRRARSEEIISQLDEAMQFQGCVKLTSTGSVFVNALMRI
jgi:HEXXH motif-containing protein